MITVLIYKLDSDEVPVASLNKGRHTLGRGPLLDCDDRRVSRNHSVIDVNSDLVTITSTHHNPCFFQTADSKTITILPKDSPVNLNNGDKFALLADQFWFKVKVENGDTEGNNNNESSEDLLAHYDGNTSNNIEKDQATKRNYEDDDDDGMQAKKAKLNDNLSAADMEEEVAKENPAGETSQQANVQLSARDAELKAMLFSSDDETFADVIADNNEGTSTSIENKDVAVGDDSKAGTSTADVKRPWRDYCTYGGQCYRKNHEHFAEYSHPGDSDYESDPNDDRPLCSFGATCYRKNKNHRKAYKHPRGGPNPTVPAKKPTATKNVTLKKRANRKNYKQDSSDDDYDMQDPFMADSGSEFEIDSVSEDDTDSDLSAGSSEETKRLIKEAKRFTKGKKKDDDD